MKSAVPTTALALTLCFASDPTFAKITCDVVLAKIEAKLVSKGITKYTLLIIPDNETTDLRVVDTCDSGAKKIIYKRG